jgi:hypothetical protein
VIEVFADFSGQGKNYSHFPDRQSYRIAMDDLRDSAVQDRLRAIWDDPQSLDPARRSAAITRDIAERLAIIARRLEKRHHRAAAAAFGFLRRHRHGEGILRKPRTRMPTFSLQPKLASRCTAAERLGAQGGHDVEDATSLLQQIGLGNIDPEQPPGDHSDAAMQGVRSDIRQGLEIGEFVSRPSVERSA